MSLKLSHSGKVRDIYDLEDGRLLLVATDRISAFDVVMDQLIPQKGRVLTAMSDFWFSYLSDLVPNHLITVDPKVISRLVFNGSKDGDLKLLERQVWGRSMLVNKARMLPLECIVRGYLSGSAYNEYKENEMIGGQVLPKGLDQGDQLPFPMFTPSTKATSGHDVNLSLEQAGELITPKLLEQVSKISLDIYARAFELAYSKGFIIADTKFEFGFIGDQLCLCDEVLTPDSSRFWSADTYQPGHIPESFDKQPLRDWLVGIGWDKTPPPPTLPEEIVQATERRYVQAYELITGRNLDDFYG
ncbi:MAG: phosphoribosylaminoimidazolesuccinocarboxamide synthase [Actinobacteria bacterium]|nr:phosphoribosylaminoimidazolesuccinocarboxamide synthase [Actinomycetota bacterium]MCL6104027.1 phosphoribosylaminoimidazolesuccinocarboxamide synthase [Actinomycetota bacterium]